MLPSSVSSPKLSFTHSRIHGVHALSDQVSVSLNSLHCKLLPANAPTRSDFSNYGPEIPVMWRTAETSSHLPASVWSERNLAFECRKLSPLPELWLFICQALCRGSIGGLSPLVIPKAGKLFIDLYQFSTPEACQPSTISVVCLNTVQKSSSPVSESVSAVVLDQGFLSLADYRPQSRFPFAWGSCFSWWIWRVLIHPKYIAKDLFLSSRKDWFFSKNSCAHGCWKGHQFLTCAFT